MRKFSVLLLFAILVSNGVFGQSSSRVRDLGEALTNGDITLTANGNGGSSGPAVNGYLRNNTRIEIRINVILSEGIYLRNSGDGQNMVAIQVLLGDGGYFSDGKRNFISLPARESSLIVFSAYCADFGLDNPSASQTFSRASMPAGIQSIVSKISRYTVANFGSDNTGAVQLALWRSQGQTRSKIAQKFSFTDADWELATKIMNY
jgi:hypothetical protein